MEKRLPHNLVDFLYEAQELIIELIQPLSELRKTLIEIIYPKDIDGSIPDQGEIDKRDIESIIYEVTGRLFKEGMENGIDEKSRDLS